MNKKKMMIIGLDCADPTLTFENWLNDLPNIKKVVEAGVYGPLRSSIPPITVPAWASMVTGQDPGNLGFYGFRNRKDYNYGAMSIVNSLSIRKPTLWDLLSQHDKRSIIIGVPPSYPPKPLKGYLISCFLTPSIDKPYTYPFNLKHEIEDLFGEYLFDVKEFRTYNKDQLLNEIYDMTEKRFKVAKHLLNTKQWDFFMMVEMGIDRIQHAFWQFMDEKHPFFDKHSKYKNEIYKYYKFVDSNIGQLMNLVNEETMVMIVSDHGAKRMDGGICINEFLIEKGYLFLKEYPRNILKLNELDIDWDKTIAWGEGGYYSRLFLNVKGREPKGTIEMKDYNKILNRLKEDLLAIGGFDGEKINTKVYKPKEIYSKTNNIAPDLLAFFGNLHWRSIGTVGHGKIHITSNDNGPDGANHDWNGIFSMARGKDIIEGNNKNNYISDVDILDITPTVLNYFDINPNNQFLGKVITQN